MKTEQPTTFDKCPQCESEERLAKNKIQELKDQQVLHKDSFNNGVMLNVPLMDPLHPPAVLSINPTVNVINIYFDACAECGCLYCTKFEVVKMPLQVQQVPGGQRRGQMPGFGPTLHPKGNNS